MSYPKTIVSVFSAAILLAAVVAWGGLASTVYAESISINFGAEKGAPTGGDLGAVPVNWQYWNNASNASGTINSLINNTGAATGVSGEWNSPNTWNFNESKPSTDNNAILYYGYLDDGGIHASFNMTSPYFSYDIYYYPATDSERFRFVNVNSVNYIGGDAGTVQGTGNWGTPVKGDINADNLVEGVNYLRVSSSDPAIVIKGQDNINLDGGGRARGSFGALQIVNTANSQSTSTSENSLVLANATWNNDLTGATGESFNASADGYRIFYTGTEETFTVDLGGATSLPKVKLFGATNLVFDNVSISQLGKTNTVTDLTKMAETVSIPNIVQVAPQGVVKFAPGVSVSSATDQASIPGVYCVDGTTVSFAKIEGGQIVAITPTYATPTDGMDLIVTGESNDKAKITDYNNRTLNTLTTEWDYLNDRALTITSGMMTLQNNSHWVQGGGTITSGYQNADGEYDLYVCGLGTAPDMRIDASTIIDNPNGKLNLIKTGSGKVSISRATSANTYSGKTVVLEGFLQIAENVRSTDFYVASGAELDFSSRNYKGEDFNNSDFTFTATKLSGYGAVEIGNGNGKISMTLDNVANDGTKFSKVNAIGKSLTMNNSELNANLVNSQTLITLNNSTINADTFNSIGDTTIKFDATSTLNAPIATTAGSLTLDIPDGRDLEITTPISGAGELVKDGAGTMTLSANNTFYGGTTVKNGTLKLNKTGGTATLAPKSAVTVDGENSILTGKGDILGYTGGAIGSLTLEDGGTLNSEANDHTTVNNVVYMNSGFITAGDNGADWNYIFDNAIHVTGDTNNQITANLICFRNLIDTSLADGDSAGLIDVAGETKLTITSAIGNYGSGEGYGPANLTKAGDGELVLTGKSPFNTDITINGGILDLTNGAVYTGTYVSGANVYVNEGGTLKVNNFGYSEGGASSLGGLTYSNEGSTNIHLNGGTIQIAESFGETIARKIELQANGGTLDLAQGVELKLTNNIHGDGALTKAGAGTLELTYANEYAGGTNVQGGYLKLTNDAVRSNGSMTVAEGATLEFALDENKGETLTFGAEVPFASEGSVIKTGDGKLKIRNDNPGSFAAKSFLVTTGELDFLGYYKGVLEIGSGAKLSPGNSIGTLTIDGSEVDPQMDAFILDSGSTLLMEVGYDANNVWTSDKLVVNGKIIFDPNSTVLLSLVEGTELPSDSFTLDLISGTGATEETLAAFSSVLIAPDFQGYALSLNGDVIQLISGNASNGVPEPSTWALLILGAAGLLYWRKRK